VPYINIQVNTEAFKQIKHLCIDEGRNQTEYVRNLINEDLDRRASMGINEKIWEGKEQKNNVK